MTNVTENPLEEDRANHNVSDDVDSTAAITDAPRKWKPGLLNNRGVEEEDSSTIASVPRSTATRSDTNESIGSFPGIASKPPIQYSAFGLLRNDDVVEAKKQHERVDAMLENVSNSEPVDSRHDMDSAKLVKSECTGDRFASSPELLRKSSSISILSPQGQSRRRAMLISIHKELKKRNQKVQSLKHPSVPPKAAKSISTSTGATEQHKKRRSLPKKEWNQDDSPQKRQKNDITVEEDDTPQPPMLAYDLFRRDFERAYVAANRNGKEEDSASQRHLMEMILQRWNEMSSKEKQPYVERAAQDQKTYHQQTSDAPGDVVPLVVPPESTVDTKSNDRHVQPRGPPKHGFEWDSVTGQRIQRNESINGSAQHSDSTEHESHGRPKVGFDLENPDTSDRTEKRQSLQESTWYANLQSSPVRTSSGTKIPPTQEQSKPSKTVTNGTAAPSGGNTVAMLKKFPKTIPKINSDGTYRKPPGTQPMGYVWNAESGYWESAVDDNMKKLLDFDEEGPRVVSGVISSEHQNSFLGSTKAAGAKKRHYTKDGCIVPNQTLERNRNGTYVRPMGRPLVGYSWNEVRGLWVPNGSSSSFSERQSVSSAAPAIQGAPATDGVDRRHSEPSMRSTKLPLQQEHAAVAMVKKGRQYTADGCIIPNRIPQLAIDGTYVRPLGRAIVGYAWDSSRGLWAPDGSISQELMKQPHRPTVFSGHTVRSHSAVVPSFTKEPKYISCNRCVGCKTAKNCGICLHCMLIEEANNDGELPSPFYVCMQRVCSAPIVNANYKLRSEAAESRIEGNYSLEPRKEAEYKSEGGSDGTRDTDDDNSVLESVSENGRVNNADDDVSDLEESDSNEDEDDCVDAFVSRKDS